MFKISSKCLSILISNKRLFYTNKKLCKTIIDKSTLKSCLRYQNSIKFYSTTTPTVEGDNKKDEIQIDYESIADGDPETVHKLKVIEMETEILRQEGRPVPDAAYMKPQHWKEMLNLASRSGRRKYLEYLFKLSKKKENKEIKKLVKRKEFEEFKAQRDEIEDDPEEFAHKYDLLHNSIMIRVYDSTINQMYNNRLIQAMQFGQKLVVDCGYDEIMSKRECVNTAKQLMLLFSENRYHDEPFDIHYCNLKKGSTTEVYLEKHIPTMYEKWFPMNIYEQSYLNLFPKANLVYLTPHCREELLEYDHDAVYIIGALVDKQNNEPVSLAKAKKEGLKMAKFPLDRYLQWGQGSGKSLTINQCVSILLDVKATGDWTYALRHVPRRKIADFNINNNIKSAANKSLRFDKERQGKSEKWIPLSNVDFNNLSFNKRKTMERETSNDDSFSSSHKNVNRKMKISKLIK